jgi:hypothetical protein
MHGMLNQSGGQKKVVIVGGAPITDNYTDFINSSDLVIRINECKNYDPKTTGRRTDILCLNSIGIRTQMYHFFLKSGRFKNRYGIRKDKRASRAKLRFLRAAKQFCFVLPEGDFLSDFLQRHLADGHPLKEHMLTEISCEKTVVELVRRQLKIKNGRLLPGLSPDAFTDLWKSLSVYGSDIAMPTTGMITIEKVLTDPMFGGYKKYIVGFTNDCWEGHPNYQEKMLTEAYCQQDKLVRVKL